MRVLLIFICKTKIKYTSLHRRHGITAKKRSSFVHFHEIMIFIEAGVMPKMAPAFFVLQEIKSFDYA